MTLQQFDELLDTLPLEDYVVRLKYKYTCEEEYTYSNELLLVNSAFGYEWNNDWHEGQEDVEVLGWLRIDEVKIPTSLFDKREVHENCTVEIWESSETGEVSIGWWENENTGAKDL